MRNPRSNPGQVPFYDPIDKRRGNALFGLLIFIHLNPMLSCTGKPYYHMITLKKS